MDPASATEFRSRLDEIESKITLNDELMDQLNQTVFRQQEQIALLQAELRLLYRQLTEATMAGLKNSDAEIPPHY